MSLDFLASTEEKQQKHEWWPMRRWPFVATLPVGQNFRQAGKLEMITTLSSVMGYSLWEVLGRGSPPSHFFRFKQPLIVRALGGEKILLATASW
jgi:hypothetical protein